MGWGDLLERTARFVVSAFLTGIAVYWFVSTFLDAMSRA